VRGFRFVAHPGTAALFCVLIGGASVPALADVRSHGPLVAVGFTDKLRNDLIHQTIGWRWQLGAGQTLEGWAKRIGADFSFVVEPSLAAIVGDKDSIETQVVPYLHFEPVRTQSSRLSPYFEAGTGLIYTALEHLGLGSNLLFSNNVGGGIAFAVPHLGPWTRLSVGYRFRHCSHAGIFGNPNSGINTHYLTVTIH
jgi:hypothetical protein